MEYYQQVLKGFEEDMLKLIKKKASRNQIFNYFAYWVSHPDFANISHMVISPSLTLELNLEPLDAHSTVTHALFALVARAK